MKKIIKRLTVTILALSLMGAIITPVNAKADIVQYTFKGCNVKNFAKKGKTVTITLKSGKFAINGNKMTKKSLVFKLAKKVDWREEYLNKKDGSTYGISSSYKKIKKLYKKDFKAKKNKQYSKVTVVNGKINFFEYHGIK